MNFKLNKNLLILFLIFGVFGLAKASLAANHFIRDGATGTSCADWSTACDSLPANLIRGDTYYIADGTYGSYTFDDAVSGTSVITIKKATASDHGTETGWNSTYGDGQAIFTGETIWTVRMSYLEVEGVTGSGTSDYGIRLNSSCNSSGCGAIVTAYGDIASHNRFRHLEMNNGGAQNGHSGAVFYNNSSSCTDIKLEYCYIHDSGSAWVWFSAGGSSGLLIDHCFFSNFGSNSPSLHSAGIIVADFNDLTLRYSILQDALGTANTTYIEPQFSSSNIRIYGNVFRSVSSNESTGQGIFAITSTDTCTNCYIYNNTIYGLHGAGTGVSVGVFCGHHSGQSIYVDNNIWQNCSLAADISGDGGGSCVIGTHNFLNGGGNFINAAAGDFRLSSATLAGASFSSPYNLDPLGNTRGADGIWDRGAYEYGGTSSNTAPAVPTGVKVV